MFFFFTCDCCVDSLIIDRRDNRSAGFICLEGEGNGDGENNNAEGFIEICSMRKILFF